MSDTLPEQVTPRIVEGVAVSAAQGGQKTDLSARIELAMAATVQESYNSGVTDSDKVRAKMLAARDAILAS